MMNHFIFYTFILSYFLLPAPPTLQTILIAVAHLKVFWKPNFNMKVWAKTNLDSMLKSRDIVLLTKVCLVKAMVFPVVMYGCESWIIKKIEHQRIDAFEPWCWGRLLRVPWTARRSNYSSPTPRFKSINSLVLSLLHGPTLTSIHDYWKNYSFDYMDLCQQGDVSAF